ncbi:MAG: hypothetical protein GPJ50_11830 [Candidatus Heimdallarchaeota archaeon]|nr:hypothetical protein [Candidatus Heimdallarchaeota archaeon]
MVSTISTKQLVLDELKFILPHQKRALLLLESNIIRERMKGYALLTTCFRMSSPDIQNHIRNKWKEEKDLKDIKKAFIVYCEQTFLG